MAGWVKAPSGAAVYQDAGGLVHLKGVNGDVKAVPAAHAAELLGDKYSGFAPASADDINAAQDAAQAAATEAKTSTVGAAARGVATGAVDAALAAPKLVTGLGAAALGKEDPLASYSGSGLVQDLGTAARHIGGDSIGKAEDASREQMMADREIHPYAHGAGELAGTIAGSIPMGGLAGGLAKAGAARLGLAGARAALAAGAGASVLEGSALGSTVGSEEAWLKGQPAATAEQTLAGIGMGGLFGLGAGVAIHGVGPAVSKFLGRGAGAVEATEPIGAGAVAEGAEAAAPEAAAVPGRATMAADEAIAPAALENVPERTGVLSRKWWAGMSDEARVEAIARSNKPAMKALGHGEAPSVEFIRDTGKTLHEMGVTATTDSGMLEQVAAGKEIAGKRIGAILDGLDETAGAEAAPRIENVLTNIRSRLTTMRKNAVVGAERRLADSLEAEIAPIEEKALARRAWNKDARAAMRGTDELLSTIEASKSAGIRDFAAKLRASVTDAQKALEGGYADATHLTPVSEALEKLTSAPSSKVRAAASDLMEHVVAVGEGADAAPRMGFRDLHTIRTALDGPAYTPGLESPAMRTELKGVRGMIEGELTNSISKADPNLLAEYALSKRRYSAASWAEKPLTERVGVRDQANRGLSLTDYKAGVGTLIASGGNPLLALGGALGNKLLRERGMSTFAVLARKAAGDAVDLSAAPASALQTARNIQTMVAHSESHIGDSVGRFLDVGGVGGSIARTTARGSMAAALRSGDMASAQRAYQDHAREVQTVASVPDVAASRLSGITGKNLPVVAPGLNAAMAAVAVRGAQYLKSNMPCAPSDPDSITPQLDSPPPASRSDLHVYANRVEGVENPLSLLDDLNKGHVSPEKVEAIKAVWPVLFDRIKQATFASLAQRTEPVPYRKRQLLDMTLDGNGALEPSLRPDSLAIMKQANDYQAQQLKEKAQRPASGGSPQIGNMLQTSADRIASR